MADLPKLTTSTSDPRAFARILRAALRNERIRVPLDRAPSSGMHLLHVVLEGPTGRAVWILAEPDGAELRVKPRSDVQSAQLYALAQLGGPTSELPPEEAAGPRMRIDSSAPTIVGAAHDEHAAAIPKTARVPSDLPPATVRMDVDPVLGRILGGRFRAESLIGRGAAGAVYKGTHVDLGRDVANKVLHASHRTDPQFVKRFEAEARAASRLEHVHVTRVLDFGREDDGLLYLVMELLSGRTLESVIAEGRRLGLHRAVDIGMQVCSALARAHAEGIIHRDIKPENIMLLRRTDDDEHEPIEMVKVCDFGVAKVMTADSLSSELTVAGLQIGSPIYMSPEQIRQDPLDPRCDVYALGVTLYECTVGRPPFDADTLDALLAKHLDEPPVRPSAIVPGYDPGLEAIVLRMLAKKFDERPTARAARAQLRDVAVSARTAAPQFGPR